jgi:hypothetical protein
MDGIRNCIETACALWAYRLGQKLPKGEHHPLAAMHTFCVACAGTAISVKDCTGDTAIPDPCPLYPYRDGHNPNISKATREIQRQRAISRGFGSKGKSKGPESFRRASVGILPCLASCEGETVDS